MVDRDLGQATIVYEDPGEETVELTVQNEHIAYFQDHWIIKTGEDDQGNDQIRRIPHNRIYYVERSVEEFEEEIKTTKKQVQSIADNLRRKILGESSAESKSGSEPIYADVESEESATNES